MAKDEGMFTTMHLCTLPGRGGGRVKIRAQVGVHEPPTISRGTGLYQVTMLTPDNGCRSACWGPIVGWVTITPRRAGAGANIVGGVRFTPLIPPPPTPPP